MLQTQSPLPTEYEKERTSRGTNVQWWLSIIDWFVIVRDKYHKKVWSIPDNWQKHSILWRGYAGNIQTFKDRHWLCYSSVIVWSITDELIIIRPYCLCWRHQYIAISNEQIQNELQITMGPPKSYLLGFIYGISLLNTRIEVNEEGVGRRGVNGITPSIFFNVCEPRRFSSAHTNLINYRILGELNSLIQFESTML